METVANIKNGANDDGKNLLPERHSWGSNYFDPVHLANPWLIRLTSVAIGLPNIVVVMVIVCKPCYCWLTQTSVQAVLLLFVFWYVRTQLQLYCRTACLIKFGCRFFVLQNRVYKNYVIFAFELKRDKRTKTI